MKRVGFNALANLAGGLLPAFVYLWSVPLTVHYLGHEGYGVFSLVTAIVGYFAVVDLNVTSGALKYIAEFKGRDDQRGIDEVLTLGALVYLVIGTAGAVGILACAPWLVSDVFSVPAGLRADSALAVQFAAAGFLVSQLQAFLQGVPQALHRYDASGMLETVFGILTPIATVAVLAAGGGLSGVMLARAVLGLANVAALMLVIRRLLPEYRLRAVSRTVARKVFSFSGFAYLSRFSAVTYAQADKFILGAISGAAAVSQYVIPFSLVNRVFSMSFRLGAVMLPAASTLSARGQPASLQKLALLMGRYTIYLNACMAAALVILSDVLLHSWLGAEVSQASIVVLGVVATASFADSLTNVPSLVNDGLGHPRVSGLFAVARAIVGVGVGLLSIRTGGVLGAAIAQLVVSVVMGAAFVFYVHGRTVPWRMTRYLSEAVGPSVPVIFVIAVSLWFGPFPMSLRTAGGVAAGCLVVAIAYAYFLLLTEEHRRLVVSVVTRGLRPR